MAIEGQVAASRNAAAADARARAATTGVLAAADEALESDWPLALLLAVEAFRLDDSDLTQRGLLNVLTQPRPVPHTIREGDRGYQAVALGDDSIALKGVDGGVEVRDLAGDLAFAAFDAPILERVNGVAISSTHVAASGMPVDGIGAVVHDVTTGEPLFDLPAREGESVEVAFSPSGDRLAATGIGRVRIVDVGSRQEQVLETGSGERIISVAWSPDGDRLLAGGFDGGLWAWDLDTALGSGAAAAPSMVGDLPLPGPSPVVAIAPLADREQVVVATFDAGAYVLDAASLQVDEGPLVDGQVTGMAVSPNGSRMAIAAFNRVPIWELRTDGRSERQTTLVADATDVAFTSDAQLVTAGLAGTVVAWDLDPPSPVVEPIPGVGAGHPHDLPRRQPPRHGRWRCRCPPVRPRQP